MYCVVFVYLTFGFSSDSTDSVWKKDATLFLPLTLPNTDQFSKILSTTDLARNLL